MAFAARRALIHLFVSVLVAGATAGLVFSLLYPSPWREMLGVSSIFGVVVIADVICGPLLTFVLSSPFKPRRERMVDLSLIAVVQLLALGYGLSTVYSARPVILAFEVDRLFLVTANEVQVELLPKAPSELRQLPHFGVTHVGLRQAKSAVEYLQSVELSMQGITQAMRPNWWVLKDDNVRMAIQKRAKPLRDLMEKKSMHADELKSAVRRSGHTSEELSYLPLTSSKDSSWIALINRTGEVVGFAPVDGFD